MSDEVVAHWIRYHTEKRGTSDPLFAAWEGVADLVDRDPEAGWALTLALIAAAPDDQVLANVAAGPLESLISRSPELMIDRVEQQARRDAKFRRCLTGVWGIPSSVRDRLAKLTSSVKDPL